MPSMIEKGVETRISNLGHLRAGSRGLDLNYLRIEMDSLSLALK